MPEGKSGFWMRKTAWVQDCKKYITMYRENSVGVIEWQEDTQEWIFTADWNGYKWSADTLAMCKSRARAALKEWFKKMKK